MLTALRVKNFILIDELELALSPGLNVLTGETGAGKSIIVGALGLVFGGRASTDHVRPGADEATVEALFELTPQEIERSAALSSLAESGSLGSLSADGSGELLIRRLIAASGRSRSYLNGRLSTSSELAALAAELADVASQHESVALSDPSTHLFHLDRFAKLDPARSELGRQVEEIELIVKRIAELRAVDRSRAEREAFVQFQLQGIDDVAPRAGEVDELAAERKRLRHGERLRDLAERAASRLEAEDGLCDQLARVASDLRAAAELDDALEPLARSADMCWAELREVAAGASKYLESADADPSRLAAVEERLFRLEGILRQHGPTLADVIAAQERLARELADIRGAESRIADEERALADRLPAVEERALALSTQRKRAAERLGAAISGELAELGMGGARVRVEVEPLAPRDAGAALSVGNARLGRDGIDRVEFLIAPNKGIEPRPLRKIASGGELSRALLALKRVLAESGPAGLYVFDEVDAGVGGAVAERIGAAIADVARHHQVLCITHLAPIAAFADAHFVISKRDIKDAAGDRTTSSVRQLAGPALVQEVARMLAGAKVGQAAIAAAEDLLADSKKAKKAMGRAPSGEQGEARVEVVKPAPKKKKA